MMNKSKAQNKPFLDEGLIQSLCYLYKELLKANMQEMAIIMEKAINDCELTIRENFTLSEESEEAFKEFDLIRRIRILTPKQRELFIREIKALPTEH